ncbi:MAG: hypothetical protein OCU22_07900 [Canidatus Methanoxibalbensis ujae]|nr:hypothetical protein [Candidatus Methanoxibalbensis ujae]
MGWCSPSPFGRELSVTEFREFHLHCRELNFLEHRCGVVSENQELVGFRCKGLQAHTSQC